MIADRVKETSTTAGTGTYSLAGAVAGFQTFVAGIGTGETCYYVATMGADWEVGIGTVTGGTPDTLARTTILTSSNANAAVNWAAGEKSLFVCAPAYAEKGVFGRGHSAGALDDNLIIGYGALAKNEQSMLHGISRQGGSSVGEHMRQITGLTASTSNATPTDMDVGDTDAAGLDMVFPTQSAMKLRISVTAHHIATIATSKAWEITALVRSGTSGASNLSVVGTPTYTVIAEDSGATTWGVAISGTSNNKLLITVTGESKIINWTAFVEATHAGFVPA